LNTLLRGQNCSLLRRRHPHDSLAAQIVRQATLGTPVGQTRQKTEQFAVVFAAMGVNTTWRITSAIRLPKRRPYPRGHVPQPGR